jgi:hypothetical protein
MCSTCFEGGLLSWTPFTSFVLSNNTTFQLLMILLVFTHIKQYALVPSQYPKNTWGMDLDFNLLLFSLRSCAYVLQLKILKWDIHHTFYSPCFLPGLWIKSFGWASIFDVNCHVHHLHPKLQIKSLCMNHLPSALHNGHVGSCCNSILLWCIRSTCLSLDSTFTQKVVKFFGHKLSSVVKLQGLIFMLVSFSTKVLYALNLSNTSPFAFKR